MFKSQNFCHIASNNRNQVKVGVFVYRTTDSLATVLTSGYFNDRIIDINLHDLIIHEKVDNTDATKVERNLLCVTGRTLETVSTSVIKSKWEGDIEQYIEETFVKKDGTSVMTAPLKFAAGSMRGAVGPYLNGVSFWKSDSQGNITNIANLTDSQFVPVTTNSIDLGNTTHTWKDAYVARVITSVLNNGYDIAVPVTNSADTLALKSQVDDAANSGEQLYTTGVWYAKMYAATVVPTGAEYDGRNYADFSQVDSDNNPVIKIYTGASGAWALTETITPPKNHNGYMTITSKIWDIAEQAGQQGGLVLWAHNQGTFTPYPRIVSFENINITGNSTVTMPANPTDNSIPNKKYVDDLIAGLDVPDLFDWKWKDCTTSKTTWALADGNWVTDKEAAYQHLISDIQTGVSASETIAGITITCWTAPDGHKIVLDSDESNITAIYNATGAAWYYIVDIINHRFKLPRVNPAREELIQTIKAKGSGLTLGLVSNAGYTAGLTTTANNNADLNWNSSAYNTSVGSAVYGTGPTVGTIGVTTDADKSGIVSDMTDSTSVFSGKKYLYFYVGH